MQRDKKEIIITGESLLMDIQEAFTRFYPFLLIEFFQDEKNSSTQTHAKLDPGMPIKAFARMSTAHAIDFDTQRTVSEVTLELYGLLGLTARVSRKSGVVWNAISLTEGWTLERQNAAGEYVSELMRIAPNKQHSI